MSPRRQRRDRGHRSRQVVPAPARAADDAQGVLSPPAPPDDLRARSARSTTSSSRSRAASSSGSSGRTAAARARCSRSSPASTGRTRGTVQVDGLLSPFIELGVGFNPELTARDNILINGDAPGPHPPADQGALRRDRRIRRAGAVRRPEAEELLVGHAGAARLLDRDPGRLRHPPARRGARRRRRGVPGEVLRHVRARSARQARRSSSSATTSRRSHRFCDRALYLRGGLVETIGPTSEVIDLYRRTGRRGPVRPWPSRATRASHRPEDELGRGVVDPEALARVELADALAHPRTGGLEPCLPPGRGCPDAAGVDEEDRSLGGGPERRLEDELPKPGGVERIVRRPGARGESPEPRAVRKQSRHAPAHELVVALFGRSAPRRSPRSRPRGRPGRRRGGAATGSRRRGCSPGCRARLRPHVDPPGPGRLAGKRGTRPEAGERARGAPSVRRRNRRRPARERRELRRPRGDRGRLRSASPADRHRRAPRPAPRGHPAPRPRRGGPRGGRRSRPSGAHVEQRRARLRRASSEARGLPQAARRRRRSPQRHRGSEGAPPPRPEARARDSRGAARRAGRKPETRAAWRGGGSR